MIILQLLMVYVYAIWEPKVIKYAWHALNNACQKKRLQLVFFCTRPPHSGNDQLGGQLDVSGKLVYIQWQYIRMLEAELNVCSLFQGKGMFLCDKWDFPWANILSLWHRKVFLHYKIQISPRSSFDCSCQHKNSHCSLSLWERLTFLHENTNWSQNKILHIYIEICLKILPYFNVIHMNWNKQKYAFIMRILF